ncbi:methyl-accepting chemotaxis protein [Amphritea pacifica]|uniref:PAS domain-containing protein n=1 Tax=Amphritea pacifica TaxID=2811233 RepID=A0ABS2WDW6_9GAMM|nr:methyl-accepting chemotaxis protein [Amphritea pacifica]MBN0989816.1 PAS domain-containing protein [Amphritea pacifica]
MNSNTRSNAFQQDDVLVLMTDPTAVISYVSDDLCRVTGYSKAELIGQNINILRHPEMPAGPFKQLWETIQEGMPWMGMILNRSRNDQDLWFDTYIIPTIEKGEITEYQCIYRKPVAETVARAADVYEQRRQGKMPKALRRKQPELDNRLCLVMLISLLPSVGWMLWHTLSAASVLAAGASALLAIIGCKWLTRRFKSLVHNSRQIVSHPVKQLIYTGTTDDIGQLELVQCMLLSQLDAILRRIQNASGEVEKSSQSSARVMASTCGSIQSQQTALVHIAAAVEQMTATTSDVANNTVRARDQSEQAQQNARQGKDIIINAVTAIKSLNQAIDRISENLKGLEQRSTQIDTVVDVIHDIADKTNLLALNAAIEAARAGENGRGFAVVADEVRSLAQRTRISTSEISTIIQELQEATRGTSKTMQEVQSMADTTVIRIEEGGANLTSIIEAVELINSMTIQIASASEQQNTATQEVNKQIHMISNAATDAAEQAQETLQLNNMTARLAQQQSNMVEIIIANQ